MSGAKIGSRMYYFESITQRIDYPFHVLATTSPRKLLFGINFLLAICCLSLAGFAIFLCQLFYDPDFTSGWIIWLGMSIVALFLAAVSIIGMRGAHMVSLDLLLTYFWGIIVFVAPLLLALFACFNFFFYTRIWFKHQWATVRFEKVRSIFCSPRSTANNKCIAPLGDEVYYVDDDYYTYQSNYTTTWCLANYNATDCGEIRDAAITKAVDWGGKVITAQSTVGLVGVFIIGWSIYISYEILTSPVITQSMMDVINYLLLLPMAGCVALSVYHWWIQRLELSTAWLPVLFLVLAISQLLALPLGIISGRMKSRALLTVYISLMVLIALGLAAAGGIGYTMAEETVTSYAPSNVTVYEIACRKSLPGCSGCLTAPQSCPEWSSKDVMSLLSLDFRLAGMVAILSILYIIGGLIVASLVDNGLKNYKTDFI